VTLASRVRLEGAPRRRGPIADPSARHGRTVCRGRPRGAALLVAATWLGVWLTACDLSDPVDVVRSGAPPAGVARDLAITAAVKASLARDRRFAALELQVQTTGGRVLLRGTTPDTVTRREAAEIVRGVAGVVEVRNDLSVQWMKP
jgi:BON domain